MFDGMLHRYKNLVNMSSEGRSSRHCQSVRCNGTMPQIDALNGDSAGTDFPELARIGLKRAHVKLRQQLVRLAEGDFVDSDVNVLAFGLPGTGKTHAMCAIGHRLVQDMLAAKRDLDLPRMLRKLDNYDLLVIDDLGYLPQGLRSRRCCSL